MAFKNALPLEAVLGDGIAKVKSLWTLETPTTVLGCPSYHQNELSLEKFDFGFEFRVRTPHFIWQFVSPDLPLIVLSLIHI